MPWEKRIIVCDYDKCNRCEICEVECATVKEDSLDFSLSRIRVVHTKSIHHMAIACVLCDKPPCVTSCPRDALSQSESGTILVDEDKCIGCGWCIQACDFGAIMTHPTKKIAICDLCEEERKGGDPPCVKICPFDALTFLTRNEASSKLAKDIVDMLRIPTPI